MKSYSNINKSWKNFLYKQLLQEVQDTSNEKSAAEIKNMQYALLKMLTAKDLNEVDGLADLIKLGYIPINRANTAQKTRANYHEEIPKFNSLLGYGAYGNVYEVMGPDGKRYAAKVLTRFNHENDSEYLIRTKIEKLRASLPPEVSKHIVKSHLIKQGEENIFIIMDYVVPMNFAQKDVLFKGSSSLKRYESPLITRLKNPQYFIEDLEDQLKNSSQFDFMFNDDASEINQIKKVIIDIVKTTIKVEFANLAKNILQNALNKEADLIQIAADISVSLTSHLRNDKKFADFIRSKITNQVLKRYEEQSKKLSDTLLAQVVSEKLYGFFSSLDIIIYKTLLSDDKFKPNKTKDEFKFASSYYLQSFKNNKLNDPSTPAAVRSFANALIYLAEKHRINWSDLHENNVMINPVTGDYVATDIGLFYQT